MIDLQKPLAHILRPTNLEEFSGHQELLGPEKLLRKLILDDQIHSIILWGPPGCGKTTLARIIAEETQAEFVEISGVTHGKSEIKEIVKKADELKRLGGKTILFVDEIHRFNKAQQDTLLPFIERGTVILIGATTENPSFELISALLSRSQVFVMNALDDASLEEILNRAIQKCTEIFHKKDLAFNPEAKQMLIQFANGDARNLLNHLETILKFSPLNTITGEEIVRILQEKKLRYDKTGEEHYNLISALHKSMRDSDPDGAIYWLVRMLEGGEDPLYIARRLVRFASEDIGMADPNALHQTVAVKEACHFIGMPECGVNLTQAVIYLSMAPKSNSAYTAYKKAQQIIRQTGNLNVPLHIRNAPTKLMKDIGYGKGYKYAHDYTGAEINQQHLPDEIKEEIFYHPTDRGIEARLKEKLDKKRS